MTGATGFIGYQLCRKLESSGDEVIGLDLIPPEHGQRLDRFVTGDIRDPATVRKALSGCEAIFSLAAAHHDFGIDEATYYSVNQDGSRVICDEADRAGIRRICWYSSCAVYGSAANPKTETTTPMPQGPYGASKLAGEDVFKAWVARGDDRRALVIRPTITFGPGNVANMYSLIRQVASGRFLIAGQAKNRKSLSYVENLLDATLYLWSRGWSGLEIFNFVEKPDLTSREIAETVAAALGRSKPLPRMPMVLALAATLPFDVATAITGRDFGVSSMRVRKLFSMETCFEAEKLASTGFRSAVPVREGIQRMVRWWQQAGSKTEPRWRQPPARVQRLQD